jgi:chemotaxis protein CheZ
MKREAESSLLPKEDYEAIEEAVMETARGRWFLAEYARRNRNADTIQIISSVEKLERLIRRDRAVPDIDRIRLDLADMAEAIQRTKHEIAQLKFEGDYGSRFTQASIELDAVVSQTELATNEILLNAEKIQELAWTMREEGVGDHLCDPLDQFATEIYTACSFQDLTGQRTRKVVTVLRYLESRINTMISIWGLEGIEDTTVDWSATGPMDRRPDAHLLNGPQSNGDGMDQSSVDDLMMVGGGEGESDQGATETAPHQLAISSEIANADVFAAAGSLEPSYNLMPTTFDVGPHEDADVFRTASAAPHPSPPPAGQIADTKPRKGAISYAGAPASIGNTALVVDYEAAASASEPQLALVAQEDPIADLSVRERLIIFG